MTFQQNQPQGLTTSCKDCVFSEKEEKTQTGCSLNRIEKFKNRGVFVVEAEDLEENEFNVIETWCGAYREEPWKEGVDDIHAKVREEYQIRAGYIVIVDEDSIGDYEASLRKTVASIESQSIPVSYLLIANKIPTKYTDVISGTVAALGEVDFNYKVVTMTEEGTTDDEAIDEAFSRLKNGFYIVAKAGHELRPNVTKNLNYAINEELLRVAYVEGYDDINGRSVQAAIHKHLNGYVVKPLREKLEEISTIEEKSNLTYTWEDIDQLCIE